MGCGCKNKGNTTPQTQQVQPKVNEQKTNKEQSVQDVIKKTIEKYYTVKKGN
jgi:hypothetical protein